MPTPRDAELAERVRGYRRAWMAAFMSRLTVEQAAVMLEVVEATTKHLSEHEHPRVESANEEAAQQESSPGQTVD